ncbi:MAG TPA: hypothetical protein DDW87_08635 [Firmicutes bacterium]|nr:hypothetical protein [Bacillota bacterium]
MRKSYVLLVVLVSLLLVGCSPSYLFDDSQTVLEVTLKRTSADQKVPANIKVRIWKTDATDTVIYSIFRDIPVEPGVSTYTFAEELPAKSAYRVTAIYGNHEGFFEVGERMVNAPREQISTATVNLAPINVTLHAPDKVYSGGSLSQFSVGLPGEHENKLDYGIVIGPAPWADNGTGSELYLDLESAHLPEVDEAQTLYYQMVVVAKEGTYIGDRPTAYFPDLNGRALPRITIHP